MAQTAALLADEVLPQHLLRQWVLSLPHALRFLLATNPAALTLIQRLPFRIVGVAIPPGQVGGVNEFDDDRPAAGLDH